MDSEFSFADETRRIIGCAIEVHRELGPGLSEKPYENALAVEFGLQGIQFEQQRAFDVAYKNVAVGKFVPDLIALGKIVVDAKVVKELTEREFGQMLTYLRVTRLPLGLLFNFSAPSLQWKRIALTQKQPTDQEINLR